VRREVEAVKQAPADAAAEVGETAAFTPAEAFSVKVFTRGSFRHLTAESGGAG